MAEKYTEAQKRASLKYQANMAQIKLTVTPEQRERLQALAAKCDTSVTQSILYMLDERSTNLEIYTANRETGMKIDKFESVEAAKKAIEQYEKADRNDGTYEADFYDVVDEHSHSLL